MNYKNNLIRGLILVVIGMAVLAPAFAFAQTDGLVPCGGAGQPPCTTCHFLQLIDNVKNFLLIYVMTPVAVLFIVIAGIMMMTAGAKPGNYEYGKKILKDTFIGILVIYGAWMITNTMIQLVASGSSVSQSWFSVQCR